MADELQVAFGKPHEEAIAFIRSKPPVARSVFDGLLPELRARAFTVTGIEEFDRLQRIRDAISDLPAGSTWDEAKAEVVSQLDALGDGADRRAELLLRTHGFQAFQAANWNVAQADSDTTHLQYLATEDDRVRDTHLALNGVILPKEDPFWQRHYPPWEWGCRCRVRPINPDLLDEARQHDAGLPPEKHLVIEGPALQRLRDGQIIRDNRAFDVTSPADRPGGESAFQWHPGDLHLDATRLKDRYDPVVWEQWKQWAQATEIRPGTTVWDWLGSGRIAPPLPAPPLPAPPLPPVVPAPPIVPPAVPALAKAKGAMIAAGFDPSRAAELDRTPAPALRHLENLSFEATAGPANYSVSEKRVRLAADGKSWGGNAITLHHEVGHHIHHELGLVTFTTVDKSIAAAAEADFKTWKKWAAKISKEWRKMFRTGAFNSAARSAFADALGVKDGNPKTDLVGAKRVSRAMDTVLGISRGLYGEGHSKAYMKTLNRGAMEAFAHTYGAIVLGDSAFQAMFPELTKAVRQALGL